ncbi:hypothetical protein [Microbacterium sp. P03]|uniref:hypothetical protein n=1 Tax=Microbacterium sp. P03 TaxID=3366946 RepID=UPI003746227F
MLVLLEELASRAQFDESVVTSTLAMRTSGAEAFIQHVAVQTQLTEQLRRADIWIQIAAAAVIRDRYALVHRPGLEGVALSLANFVAYDAPSAVREGVLDLVAEMTATSGFIEEAPALVQHRDGSLSATWPPENLMLSDEDREKLARDADALDPVRKQINKSSVEDLKSSFTEGVLGTGSMSGWLGDRDHWFEAAAADLGVGGGHGVGENSGGAHGEEGPDGLSAPGPHDDPFGGGHYGGGSGPDGGGSPSFTTNRDRVSAVNQHDTNIFIAQVAGATAGAVIGVLGAASLLTGVGLVIAAGVAIYIAAETYESKKETTPTTTTEAPKDPPPDPAPDPDDPDSPNASEDPNADSTWGGKADPAIVAKLLKRYGNPRPRVGPSDGGDADDLTHNAEAGYGTTSSSFRFVDPLWDPIDMLWADGSSSGKPPGELREKPPLRDWVYESGSGTRALLVMVGPERAQTVSA